ncbi:hypothetical protein BHU72_09980 [Desulfuribacillus stibiiarsenatis]|uniref:HTH cro/C1-type domain-containing protein n=1 Tax=Desulfuribacillus stibiiarsenatis TaxID=1390249 RepID=A0A1E5L8V7_9FIRM|nr:helix-turn-helix transcriptional regulator [Desulfuribacillus stibiiarsenatis]OEH86580.1 hypothetical protein BHU72_09980 [Desulfuribacillus stibiiarsenatis]
MNYFGPKLRLIRMQKGIGLNQLANKLDISSGYLSNLERGKTDTIPLTLLNRLEQELSLSVSELIGGRHDNHAQGQPFDEYDYRLKICFNELAELQKKDIGFADYLITIVEKGLELSKKQ